MFYDVVVIGAGQAGLAAGYSLKRAGLRFVMLEAGDAPGGSWPRYYDSLTLNTPARYSSLPGLAFPGPPNHYPARDEVTTYLRDYAEQMRLPVVTGAWVQRVERADRHFRVLTSTHGEARARAVIAASGSFGSPYWPRIAGMDEFRGRLLHLADYRQPEQFRGQRIVIVGGGNGAVRVGSELAAVARVTLASRHPIHFQPQRVLGYDVHFWLQLSGLGWRSRPSDRSLPVYAGRAERARLASARLERRPLFARLDASGVVWPDGSSEPVDTVIFATGYRPHLPYLAELGALGADGRVQQRAGSSTSVPGLYYVGLAGQRTAASATIRGVGSDARVVVDQLVSRSQARQFILSTPWIGEWATPVACGPQI